MGISTCVIAVLLAVIGTLADPLSGISLSGIELRQRLTVLILRDDPQPVPSPAMESAFDPALSQDQSALAEHADAPQNPLPVKAPALSTGIEPSTDWHAVAQEVAKASVDQDSRYEATRAAMWRQSRSIMFQPAKNVNAGREAPVLPDFQFKPEIHVVGLGLTIGSCFFGVPLAGVPVEQRTVAITLFVCARDSG